MDVERAIREYLPQILHMSLATSVNNQPWVCEVHFFYDDELNLYLRSLTSRRHSQEISANPRVAGNIVTQHVLDQKVRGVYFEGTAELLEKPVDVKAAYKHFVGRYGENQQVLDDASKADGHQFYKIKVQTYYLFDTLESNPSQKYALNWKK